MKIIKKILNQVQVNLPTRFGDLNIIAYADNADELMPHLALLHPDTNFENVVNVRIHSECMTGDVFGSFRCECGEQLTKSLEYIGVNTGVLIYLIQEGSGIGLINKLHAYIKQDEGFDTAEANKELGFGYDDRTYEDAIMILKDLKISNINLISNNPEKIRALDKESSISVQERIELYIKPRKENVEYLRTKKDKFGHYL